MAKEEKKIEERLTRQREREAMMAKIEQERIHRQAELDRLHWCGVLDRTGTHFLAPKVEEETHTSTRLDNAHAVAIEDSFNKSTFSPAAAIFGDFDADEMDETESKPNFHPENEVPLDLSADFKEELQKIIKQERSPTPSLVHVQREHDPTYNGRERQADCNIKNEDTKDIRLDINNQPPGSQQIEKQSLWKSSQQVTLFRKSAMNVASEYLRSKQTELSKGKKRSYSIRDSGAYETGKMDSRNIDVRRRRVENA